MRAEGFYYVIYPIRRDEVRKLMEKALKGWVPDKAIPHVLDDVFSEAEFSEAYLVGWGGKEEQEALRCWRDMTRELEMDEDLPWKEVRVVKVIKVAKLEEEGKTK